MTGQPLLLSFGPFLLDEANARLSNGELVVPLPPKAFSLLCALAGRPGRLVEKATLLDVVWPRQDVNEAVLKTTVVSGQSPHLENRSQAGDHAVHLS